MQHSVVLHEEEVAWLGDGPSLKGGLVIAYRVSGMPDGRTARIANFGAPNGNDWQIMRIHADNTQTGWTGHYKSVEEALAALENDC